MPPPMNAHSMLTNTQLALLLVMACALNAAALPPLLPGKEVLASFPMMENPAIIRLPDDYSADRNWPVVFHFHGTGGRPTLSIPLAYTDGKSFVLVGMEYATKNLPPNTPDYLEREWANLTAVRKELAAAARIDTARVYVGGFSQGGWFASEFMEVHGHELAGAYILGAGKRPKNKRPVKPFGGSRPVYLGAGQLDLNYPFTVGGIKHFANLGGQVTFEDYLGLPHQMPMGGSGGPLAPGMWQWFRVESLRGQPASLRNEAEAWLNEQLATRDEQPLETWLRLSRAARLPFFRVLPSTATAALQERLTLLEKDIVMKDELAARAAYLPLIDRELRGSPDPGLWQFVRDLGFRHAALWQQHPEAYHGKCSALQLARLDDMCRRINLWRFPNEAAKQQALAEAAAKPFPSVPLDELKREFADLWQMLAQQP